ncbi:hypothetical protein [Fischerella sp. PCC 9605]|nr:hypothetical protein [Fischerella sp. PCC 9605]
MTILGMIALSDRALKNCGIAKSEADEFSVRSFNLYYSTIPK